MSDFTLLKKDAGDFELVIKEGVAKIPDFSALQDKRLRNVTEVTIPDSVTEIENYAFMNFDSLKRITLPDSLTQIGKFIFMNCISLEEVKLPSGLTIIPFHIFEFCINLKSIIIPQTVNRIDDGAFRHCHNLQNISLPDGLVSIGSNAFEGCENLKALHIPDGLNILGRKCFSECISLKEINIPDKVSVLPIDAFSFCVRLEKIMFPKKLKKIDVGCFFNCEMLNNLDFPPVIFREGNVEEAFQRCSSLKDIKLTAQTAASIPLKSIFYNQYYTPGRTVKVIFESKSDLQVDTEFFSVSEKEMIFKVPLFKILNDKGIAQICEFLKNPVGENLKGIKMDVAVPLAIAYHKHDDKILKYLKSHIVKVLEFITASENLTYLDMIIDNKFISKRMIDKCLEYAREGGFHEMFIELAGYKERLGAYEKEPEDRLRL